ncbi:MAG: hypothetical protein L0G87_10925 [Renibacterium salmoninarum]|nr:hypothetical protein [Renibacterium salmoninarum]
MDQRYELVGSMYDLRIADSEYWETFHGVSIQPSHILVERGFREVEFFAHQLKGEAAVDALVHAPHAFEINLRRHGKSGIFQMESGGNLQSRLGMRIDPIEDSPDSTIPFAVKPPSKTGDGGPFLPNG